MRLTRLAWLLAQHPGRWERALVDRGWRLGWLRRHVAPFWDQIRPPGLPITDYVSYRWCEYELSARFRGRHPAGDHFEDRDGQGARLLSYALRQARHPLRMLPHAWWLRGCRAVLEFGAGTAPYATFLTQAWPLSRQSVLCLEPQGTLLHEYLRWRWAGHPQVKVISAALAPTYDGIVCTEVFEHLPDPAETARWMTHRTTRLAFDYVDDGSPQRAQVLTYLGAQGRLRGPSRRGLYRWEAA